jgi:hypothetical protein
MPRSTLVTADGVRLAGRRWCTDTEPRAAVVVVHGFSASATDPDVATLAAILHADGYDVVTYDARGHGSSAGESTLGDHEQHDVAAAVDLARTRHPRVVLVGASMGAIAAVRYAATDPHLAGVVAVSCPAEWKLPRNARAVLAAAMTRTGLGRRVTSRLVGVRVASRWTNPEPPLALVPRLEMPVAFVHGEGDRFIPVADARALHAVAAEPRRLEVVTDLGHAFEPPGVEPIRDCVAWVLAHSPERPELARS